MPACIIVGTLWGDEGKGKMVDFLAGDADIIARFQGGSNAGHEVMVEGKLFTFHLVPSGVMCEGKICLIGNGVVVDPRTLIGEIEALEEKGFDASARVKISEGAHVVMPYHITLDLKLEELRADTALGNLGVTGRGIGPTYVDKVDRSGIRMGDLLCRQSLEEKLQAALKMKNFLLVNLLKDKPVDIDQILDEYLKCGEKLRPNIIDTSLFVNEALDHGQKVLMEGAQGTLLDLDYGTYPFVTSSNTISGNACVGLGVGPKRIDQVYGVVKAYATRVGGGPFPTEETGDLGDRLREQGDEYGRTTGRPRRCGWLDAVALRRSVRLNGISGLMITNLDVLTGFDPVRICTVYDLDGDRVNEFPNNLTDLSKCKPVYESHPGWDQPITDARRMEDLPSQARDYLGRISELTGCPIAIVSVGQDRSQTIQLQSLWD